MLEKIGVTFELYDDPAFIRRYNNGDAPEASHVTIPNMPVKKTLNQYRNTVYHGKVALRFLDEWKIVAVEISRYDSSIEVHCFDSAPGVNTLAFPIDSRMTPEDINGATIIYANSDNTGWLFSHGHEGYHKDHEIALFAGLEGVFQPVFRLYQNDILTATSTELADLSKSRFSLLTSFYSEVIKLARTNARGLLLGHRIRSSEIGHVHAEIKAAFDTIKAKWNTSRSTDVEKLRSAFSYFNTALNIPTPETRWEKAARLKAAAAEQEGTENG